MTADTLIELSRVRKQHRNPKNPSLFRMCSVPLPTTSRAVKRSNLKVRILKRPQNSLKNLLVESRPYDKSCKDVSKRPICHKLSAPMPYTQKDVVYIMTCDLCGRGYVGETSRPLVVRYKEHCRSAANPTAPSYKNMAFSRHYMECHPAQ